MQATAGFKTGGGGMLTAQFICMVQHQEDQKGSSDSVRG